MITLQELCRYLDELLQPPSFQDYCPNGLQVEGSLKIKKIATGVSASLATIQAAAEGGAQALIVHHGMFWNRDSYVLKGVKLEKLRLLLKHNISLLGYHLPLDAHPLYGNNWTAAREMGWKDLQPFGIYNGMAIGVKGCLGPMPREKFVKQLEEYYQHPAHCVLGGAVTVHTAALISGGAYKSIADAVSAKVDCFVTGSFDEPVWHQALEERINFFALGHSHTEKIGPRALGLHLGQHFGIQQEFLDIENPF